MLFFTSQRGNGSRALQHLNDFNIRMPIVNVNGVINY